MAIIIVLYCIITSYYTLFIKLLKSTPEGQGIPALALNPEQLHGDLNQGIPGGYSSAFQQENRTITILKQLSVPEVSLFNLL